MTTEIDQSEDVDIVRDLTAVVREADRVFERVGGSSRHWARDCFLPLLNAAGLRLARVTWQSIETAPKDGAMVVGFDQSRESEGLCGVELMRWIDGAWLDPETHACKPTHWMPVPPITRGEGQ